MSCRVVSCKAILHTDCFVQVSRPCRAVSCRTHLFNNARRVVCCRATGIDNVAAGCRCYLVAKSLSCVLAATPHCCIAGEEEP